MQDGRGMTGTTGHDGGALPPPAELRSAAMAALTRILASEAFRASGRSRHFLSYVVTETLAGRGARLSERTVGRYALERGGEFDGRFDASVRVQATRVRRSLHDYYDSDGRDDPIRIEVPVGSYQPTFTPQETSDGDTQLDPGLVIVSFDGLGHPDATVIAAVLTDSISHRLATFPAIKVVGPISPTFDDPRRIASDTQSQFVLQGRALVEAATLRLSARLTDGGSGQVVWSVSETFAKDEFTDAAVEDAWVGAVAGELGDMTGVVARQPLNDADPGSVSRDFAARAAFHRYLELGNAESVIESEKALREALSEGPRPWLTLVCHASALAVRALYGLSEDRDGDLAEAESLARESLAQNPAGALAMCALATVAIGRRQWKVARLHAAEAAQRAPWHPISLVSAGSLLALAGDIPGGAEVLRRALRLHPTHPGYIHAHLALERLLAGDHASALAEASFIQSPGFVWGPLYRAMALAGMGHLDQARADLDEALLIEPGLLADPVGLFTRYTLLSDEQLEVLLQHLEPLGFVRA